MAQSGLDTAYATFEPSGVIFGESNSEGLAASTVSLPAARSLTQISRLPDRSALNASLWFAPIDGNTSVERSLVTRTRLPVALPCLRSMGNRHTLVLAVTLEKTRFPFAATEGSPSSSGPSVRRLGLPPIFPVFDESVSLQRFVVSRRAEKNTWSFTHAAGPAARRFCRANNAKAPVATGSPPPSAGATHQSGADDSSRCPQNNRLFPSADHTAS